MSQTILDKIAVSVRKKMEARRLKLPMEQMVERAANSRIPFPFEEAFNAPGVHVIAEVKFRSPALGVLEAADTAMAISVARSYRQGGARAISVLTEEEHFHGSAEYLREIRRAEPDELLLMKDFVVDEYQILEGRAHGADAILLIVSLLGKGRTEELLHYAHAQKLSVLVEVHDEAELQQAIAMGAKLIGINNRNLKTLEVSLSTSFQLIQKVPAGIAFISESGIQTGKQMKELHEAGFSGFLIGSAFMGSKNPGEILKNLIAEAAENGTHVGSN